MIAFELSTAARSDILTSVSTTATEFHYGGVAQWLEQRAHNLLVAGSSPATPTT